MKSESSENRVMIKSELLYRLESTIGNMESIQHILDEMLPTSEGYLSLIKLETLHYLVGALGKETKKMNAIVGRMYSEL